MNCFPCQIMVEGTWEDRVLVKVSGHLPLGYWTGLWPSHLSSVLSPICPQEEEPGWWGEGEVLMHFPGKQLPQSHISFRPTWQSHGLSSCP